MARIVNNLAAMTPEQYSGASDDEKSMDSIFYGAVEQYIQYGVPREEVMADPDISKVDMSRSKRIYDEYMKNNAE